MKNALCLLCLLGLVLSACSGQAEGASIVGKWKLTAYGPAEASVAAAPDAEAVIQFDEEGKVGGSLGCNQFGGNYILKGKTIEFGALTSTLMACPEPQMSQEQAAFSILSGTVTYQIADLTLTITNNDEVLVFEMLPQEPGDGKTEE